ncbi:MAG: hypothetical protein AB8G18_19315 [Gammaproteobacteria bacterium]
MKTYQVTFLIVAALVSEMALAKPFWCTGGTDRETDHPLSIEALSNASTAGLSTVDKLNLVSKALNQNVDTILQTSRFQANDENDLLIFQQAMSHVIATIQTEGRIEAVRLSLPNLKSFGLSAVDCLFEPGTVATLSPVLKSIYYASHSANSFANQATSVVMDNTVQTLALRTEEFNNWILSDESLAQWPWEMYLNGKLVSSDFSQPAPLTQIIALRPSAGLNLSYASQEDADVVPAFAFEPIGFIRYADRSYKEHIGASLLVTVGTEGGAGYGLAFRWNGYWAGYTVHSGDGADAVYLGVDLYRYLQSDEAKTRAKTAFVQKLEAALNKP